jgi:hypothetical protein
MNGHCKTRPTYILSSVPKGLVQGKGDDEIHALRVQGALSFTRFQPVPHLKTPIHDHLGAVLHLIPNTFLKLYSGV